MSTHAELSVAMVLSACSQALTGRPYMSEEYKKAVLRLQALAQAVAQERPSFGVITVSAEDWYIVVGHQTTETKHER